MRGAVAVVTGGSRGIGAAICEELGRVGAKVVVNYSGSQGPAEEVVDKIAQIGGGGEAVAIQADVSDPNDAQRLIDQTIEQFGRIDILINNAGVDFIRSATEITLAEWDRVQHVNLRAPWLLSRAVLPHMVERGSGQIVNVASTASKKGWSNASAYAASKHGVMGLTQALHAEGKEHGVRVMAVVAGGMRTNFFRTLDPPPPPENLQPPENVASSILFMVCLPAESVIHELIVTPMTETSYP